MAYNGTVEVISGLVPKNGAKFPIVEASAVYMSDAKMLSDILEGFEETTLKDYLDTTIAETTESVSQYNERLNALEEAVGTNSTDIGEVGGQTQTLSGRVNALEEAVGINAGDIGEVGTETKTIAERVTVLESSVGDVASGTDTLANRLSSVEEELGTNSESDKTLKDRVVAIEEIVGVNTSDIGEVGEETNTISTRVTSLESKISSLENSSSSHTNSISSVNSRVSSLEGNVNSNTSRVNALETTVGNVSSGNTSLTTQLNNEVTARSDADSALSARLDNIETTIGNNSQSASVMGRVKILETTVTTIDSQLSGAITDTVNSLSEELKSADVALDDRVSALESFTGSLDASATSLSAKVATNTNNIASTQSALGVLEAKVNSMNSSFVVVSSVSAMTDQNALYINTEDNKWYYYDTDESTFIPGGNIVGINIDTTLTQSYQAADAKTVGDKFTAVENTVANLQSTAGALQSIPSTEFMDVKMDTNNKILEGTAYDGRRYFANDVIAPNIIALENKVEAILKALNYV